MIKYISMKTHEYSITKIFEYLNQCDAVLAIDMYRIHGILGGDFNMANHVNIAKLNIHHLGCKHRFLSIQHSKPPIKNLANCIFRVNRQIFDSPIIPHIR